MSTCFATAQVKNSREFWREGVDIHSHVDISLAQAALGGQVRIPGIYEEVLLTVPPCTSSHTRLRLPGKGISRVNAYGYGDHYVHVRIRPPARISEEQRALLLSFATTEKGVNGSVEGTIGAKDGSSGEHMLQ